MFYARDEFEGNASLPSTRSDAAFQDCTLRALDIEGEVFSGVMLSCVIEDVQFYWTLFMVATFVNVEFKRCVFRGITFANCVFVECSFDGCQFIRDNLNGECRFEENRWYACKQSNCRGLDPVVLGAA